jgi:4-amino-4-deoxy-L-arabinose transferase-like glycosyltransferase
MIPAQVTPAYLTDESMRRTRDSLLIFAGALLLFMVGLNPEFIGFQSRFGLFAQEMFRFGPSYFPTTYQNPYPDYPGTSTFLIYLVSKLVGQVTPFTAILPTAVTSALILVLTYRIGAIRSR